MHRHVRHILVLSLLLAAAGCSSAPSSSGPGGDYAARGPYRVGATTLDLGSAGSLGERQATVFYPADATEVTGHQQFSYELTAPLPQALTAIVPARFNPTVRIDAYVDAPGAHGGPFPVVLFSHGFGASRLYYSHLLAGIASWGFVVVSADYLERGLLAQATHSTVPDSPALDRQTMFASLTAAELAAAEPGAPLYRLVNAAKVAAVGHSAGGQTAFDALTDPRVATAVGWAPVGPASPVPPKPVTIIGEPKDVALTPAALRKEFERSPGPTTFVEISGAGHNSYTDICSSIRSGGGGLVGFAISLHVIGGELAKLATNGCTVGDRTPERFWPVVQAYTVAALRHGLAMTTSTTPSAETGRFPPFSITVQQHR